MLHKGRESGRPTTLLLQVEKMNGRTDIISIIARPARTDNTLKSLQTQSHCFKLFT